MVRKYLLTVGCLLGLFTSQTYSQANTTLSIDSFDILNTFVNGDTAIIGVQVRVFDGFVSDTLVGDIYYHYQTDKMDSLGIPPITIELDAVIDTVSDPFWDIIEIPIDTAVMRTGPLNLIVVWPAMVHPAVQDTDSVVFNLQLGYDVGLEPEYPEYDENILYPSPTMHYLYIRPDEIDDIEQLFILNMQGQKIETFSKEKLMKGWINLDHLNSGVYLAVLQYRNGRMVNKKILKE